MVRNVQPSVKVVVPHFVFSSSRDWTESFEGQMFTSSKEKRRVTLGRRKVEAWGIRMEEEQRQE
jgi:hypothetical protein